MSQSTILNEDFSIHNIISVKNRNTDNFTKKKFFKTLFQISNTTVQQIPLYNKKSLQCSILNTLKLHKKNMNN